jgi:hypothetical protein
MKKYFIWKKTNSGGRVWQNLVVHFILFLLGISAGLIFVKIFMSIR